MTARTVRGAAVQAEPTWLDLEAGVPHPVDRAPLAVLDGLPTPAGV